MKPQKLPHHDERLAIARQVAGWHLGYPSWADKFIAAYCNPDQAREALAVEQGEV